MCVCVNKHTYLLYIYKNTVNIYIHTNAYIHLSLQSERDMYIIFIYLRLFLYSIKNSHLHIVTS